MKGLSDAIDTDMNMNPVITPVLDLSQVQSGAHSLSGMLDQNKSYTLASTVAHTANLAQASQNGSNLSTDEPKQTIINNNFNLSGLTVRSESDIDEISRKLYQKQQIAMRGKGMRTVYATTH